MLPCLAACKRSPDHARVDPALAPLIPADSTALAGLRLDLLKKSALWATLFPSKSAGPLDGLRERTGMDVADDLYEVVYCLGGKHRLILLRGKFTDGGIANSGLEPELKIAGGQKLPYKGYILQGREDAAVVFFNSSVALAGKAAALRDRIDARNAQKAIQNPVAGMVDGLPHEAQIYFVSGEPRLPEGGLGGLKSIPFVVKSLAAYLAVRETIALHAEAQSYGEDGARKAAESLRGMLSLLKFDHKNADFVDRLQVRHMGSKVLLGGDFTLEAAATLVKTLDLGG